MKDFVYTAKKTTLMNHDETAHRTISDRKIPYVEHQIFFV